MIYAPVLIIHVLLSLFMIGIILLQGGRGGLGEALGGAAAQSLFGGGVNTVMTRLTAICAGLFMVTCLSLAILSTARGKSVIERMPLTPQQLPNVLPHIPESVPTPPVQQPQTQSTATPQKSTPTAQPKAFATSTEQPAAAPPGTARTESSP